MTAYILKLLILVPLTAGLAWGSLWLWRRVQQGVGPAGRRERLVQLVDALPLGPATKLAVVEFEGKRLLLSVSRTGVQLLSGGDTPTPTPTQAPFPATLSKFGG